MCWSLLAVLAISSCIKRELDKNNHGHTQTPPLLQNSHRSQGKPQTEMHKVPHNTHKWRQVQVDMHNPLQHSHKLPREMAIHKPLLQVIREDTSTHTNLSWTNHAHTKIFYKSPERTDWHVCVNLGLCAHKSQNENAYSDIHKPSQREHNRYTQTPLSHQRGHRQTHPNPGTHTSHPPTTDTSCLRGSKNICKLFLYFWYTIQRRRK